MPSPRRRKGSAIAFSAVLALVLVVLGIGFFLLSMYMGAQNETKNATDAGALNVGKQVLNDNLVTVTIGGTAQEEFFRDVTNITIPVGNVGDGKVNLTNINRIWAKALMVAINADAAGSAAGSAASSVQAAYDGAQSLSNKLSDKLTAENNLHGYFEDYSKQNSTRMIGIDTKVVTLPGAQTWQTSLMDRAKESNIEIDPTTLPIGYNLPADYDTPTTRNPVPSGATGKTFLKGYFPLTVSGHTYWTVPFQYDGKPHLVSRTLFEAEQKPPHDLGAPWNKPVPNAFSVGGKVATKPGVTSETAMSWVQSNPRQTFPFQFPNGFIRVVLKKHTLQWTLLGVDTDSTTYRPFPVEEKESGDGVPYPLVPICATVSGTAHMAMEYIPPTLNSAINYNTPPFLPGSSPNQPMKFLLQRCQEMVPDCKMSDLVTALNECPTLPEDDDQKFFIYPLNGKIVATPKLMTPPPLGCDASADPEGDEEWSESKKYFEPNFFIEHFTCNGTPAPPFPMPIITTVSRSWKPGTGYKKGCLGELTVGHDSTANIIPGFCSCPII
ncbi:MAG: hypothetical protein U0103_17785 [Candidatus Obscuribacterales bacterium]